MDEEQRSEHLREAREKRIAEREGSNPDTREGIISIFVCGAMILGCSGIVSGCTPNPELPQGSSLQPIDFGFGDSSGHAERKVQKGLEYESKIKAFGGIGKVVEVFSDGKAILENLNGDRVITRQPSSVAVRGDVYRLGVALNQHRKEYYITLDERLDSNIINRPGFRFKSEIELEFLLSHYGDEIKESVN